MTHSFPPSLWDSNTPMLMDFQWEKRKHSIGGIPDEMLLHIFELGTHLPEFLDDFTCPERHPRRKKPFATLVSLVCYRWREIINQDRSQRFWCTSLRLSTSDDKNIGNSLARFKRDLDTSQGSDLFVGLHLCRGHGVNFSTAMASRRATQVRLFMHGILMLVPFCDNIMYLKADIEQREAVDLLQAVLDLLGARSRLTLMDLKTNDYSQPHDPCTLPGDRVLINNRPYGLRLRETLPALSHLRVPVANVQRALTLPLALRHLVVDQPAWHVRKPWSTCSWLFQQSASLVTLSVNLEFVIPEPSFRPTRPAVLQNLQTLTLTIDWLGHLETLERCLQMPKLRTLNIVCWATPEDTQGEVEAPSRASDDIPCPTEVRPSKCLVSLSAPSTTYLRATSVPMILALLLGLNLTAVRDLQVVVMRPASDSLDEEEVDVFEASTRIQIPNLEMLSIECNSWSQCRFLLRNLDIPAIDEMQDRRASSERECFAIEEGTYGSTYVYRDGLNNRALCERTGTESQETNDLAIQMHPLVEQAGEENAKACS